VHYRGYDISQVLDLTVEEALDLFKDIPAARSRLQLMADVGLGYLQLGQPTTTLSGGEAQRVKLAKELGRRSTGRTLYLLDEPTTGLHPADTLHLLQVLQRLVDAGNSVMVIEHNLDLVKAADWVIDLGPEGGAAGGRLVAAGTPEQIAQAPGSHTGACLQPLL
jgi:excinuclease ABC subunit A